MLLCPALLTHEYLHRFIQVQHLSCEEPTSGIQLDCRALRFVDPMGLCLLHHWFTQLHERGQEVHLVNLPLNIESFLARMDLFDGIDCVHFDDRTSSNQRHDLTGQAIEVTQVKDIREVDNAAARLAEAVAYGIPDLDFSQDPDGMTASVGERFADLLEYVFAEILLNTMQHGRRRGWDNAYATIAAQYYPKRQRLGVAILDNGCGLLETLQRHPAMEGEHSHQKAIEIALRPRISSNYDGELGLDMRNQGIGLTMSTQIALASQGLYGIFSGNAWLRSQLPPADRVRAIPYWQGTGVYLEFDRSTMGRVQKHLILRQIPGFAEVGALTFG